MLPSDLLHNFGASRYVDLFTAPMFVRACVDGTISAALLDTVASSRPDGLATAPVLLDLLTANLPRIKSLMFSSPDEFDVASPAVFLLYGKDSDPHVDMPVAVCPPLWIRSHLLDALGKLTAHRTAASRNAALPLPKAGVWQSSSGVIYPSAWATSGHLPQTLRRALRMAAVRGMPAADYLTMVRADDPANPAFALDRAVLPMLEPLAESGLSALHRWPAVFSSVAALRLALHAPRWLGLPSIHRAVVATSPTSPTSKGRGNAFLRVATDATIDDLLLALEPTLAALRRLPPDDLLPAPDATHLPSLQRLSLQAAQDAEALLATTDPSGVRRWFRTVALRHCEPGVTVVQITSVPVVIALLWYWGWVAPLMHTPLRGGGSPDVRRHAVDTVAEQLCQLGVQNGDYTAEVLLACMAAISTHVRKPY